MGEIKSTIDLVMEKTKRMRFSAKEHEQLKDDDYRIRAGILAKRYLNSYLNLDGLKKEIANFEEAIRGRILQDTRRELIDSLDPEGNFKRILAGIRVLTGESNPELIDGIERLIAEYHQARSKRYQTISDQMKELLEKEGIFGDAVDPRVATDPTWEEALNQLQEDYREKLKRLKKN